MSATPRMLLLSSPRGRGPAAGLAAMCLFFAATSAWAGPANVWARTILHADGSRTESKKDNNSRVIEQMTYDVRGVLVMKRIVQIDARGQSKRGFIFDGENELIYKIGYIYDEIDRLEEEILYNTDDAVVRRMVYSYDASGKQLTPKAYTFTEAAPVVASRVLAPEAALAGAERAAAAAEARASAPATPEQPQKKKRFRLFRRN